MATYFWTVRRWNFRELYLEDSYPNGHVGLNRRSSGFGLSPDDGADDGFASLLAFSEGLGGTLVFPPDDSLGFSFSISLGLVGAFFSPG